MRHFGNVSHRTALLAEKLLDLSSVPIETKLEYTYLCWNLIPIQLKLDNPAKYSKTHSFITRIFKDEDDLTYYLTR